MVEILQTEIVRYGLWGVLTIVFSYVSYILLKLLIPYNWANLISIIATKVFAYITNKKYVFRSDSTGKKQFFEMLKYIIGRGFTGVVDYCGLIFFTEVLLVNDYIGKILVTIIVTILNYLIGKLFVFAKHE